MPLSTFLHNHASTRLRGLMFLALDESAIIQKRVSTSDSGGGASEAWVAAGTTVCRIYPVTIRGRGAVIGGQINERTTHFCEMPPNVSVNVSERILVGTRGTFEVTMGLETTDALATRIEVFQVS